jgi:hypothetical protein
MKYPTGLALAEHQGLQPGEPWIGENLSGHGLGLIGRRVLRGEVVGDGQWPPLVTEDTFWACARLLGDPSRTTTRPGRAVYLLSYIATA